MTKKPKIWYAEILSNTRMIRSIQCDFGIVWREFEPKYKIDNDLSLAHAKRCIALKKAIHTANERVSDDMWPRRISFETTGWTEKKMAHRDMFLINSAILVVSHEMVEVLKQFNIGEAQFHEVPLWHREKNRQRPGRYYIMNIVDAFETFIPEQSEGLMHYANDISGSPKWAPRPGNKTVAIDSTKSGDFDLWMDTRFLNIAYFSDRLRMAIKEAKLNIYGVSFKPCKIIK